MRCSGVGMSILDGLPSPHLLMMPCLTAGTGSMKSTTTDTACWSCGKVPAYGSFQERARLDRPVSPTVRQGRTLRLRGTCGLVAWTMEMPPCLQVAEQDRPCARLWSGVARYQIEWMSQFIFRCPATGFNVQHQLDDDPDISENDDPLFCLHRDTSGQSKASCWVRTTSKGRQRPAHADLQARPRPLLR